MLSLLLLRRAMRLMACMLGLAAGLGAQGEHGGAPGSYRITHWSIENGLPQGSANDLLQTPDGALWIGTFGGLMRFDGIEFRTFDLDTLPGLPSVRITGLESDGANGLWVLTQSGGLLHVQNGAILESLTTPGTTQDSVAVVRSSNGELWVRGGSGDVWRHHEGTWSPATRDRLAGATYANMCATQNGGIALASQRSLIRFDERLVQSEPVDAPARITALAEGAQPNELWVGLADGIAMARGSVIERVALDPPLSRSVTALIGDGAGGVWVGSGDELIHVIPGSSAGTWVRTSQIFDLPEHFGVQSLLIDNENNLWVGSRDMGLVRLTRRRVERIDVGAPSNSISALCSDGKQGAWLSYSNGAIAHGTTDASLGREARPSWEYIASPIAVSMLPAADGTLWVSHDKRLVRRQGTEVVFELDLPPRLGALAQTTNGELWVTCSNGDRLLRLNESGAVLETVEMDTPAISLVAGLHGDLWIGCNGSITHRAEGQLRLYDHSSGIPQGDVRDMLPEPDGSLWIATYGGGLAYMRSGRAVSISRSHGLPNNALSHILDDAQERLWLLSNQGLILVPKAELRALANGTISRIDPVVLGSESGMPEANYGSPAGFRDEEGRLWFGTISGAVRIDPRDFPFKRAPPQVHIERVTADDAPLTLQGTVRVPPASRRIVFDFTTFSLTAPERVHYRYRLDGYDESWNECGPNRTASYTGLKPGRYTLRVMARNEDGVWSAVPVLVSLDIAPSWWETNLFWGAVVFAAIAVLYVLDRVRIGVIRRRARTLLEATEGRARAEERESRLRDDLAHVGRVATAGELATSLAHEVNQPLAAIVTNAQAGRRYLAKENLDRPNMEAVLREIAEQGQRASDIIQRLREFLRKHRSDRRLIDLNQVVRDTLPLVRRELHDHRVEVRLDLDDREVRIDADPIQIQQIVVNLVHNACEAMSRNEDLRRVELHTSCDAQTATLEIRDTGPGLAPEVVGRVFMPYVTTKATGMGLGLAICRSIVEAHGGRIHAVNSPGGGVVFRMDLPAHRNGGSDT
ncbi:MAG: GHKL domain-containing protein [Planctomycetes bacterium]|nr:GHKL domain-containing protein [Planctomycetota bacterium]